MRVLSGGVGAALAVVLLLGQPAAVSAQDSRQEEIAAAQAEKAKTLAPYVPSKAEQRILQVQHALFSVPNGFYPYFGSAYRGGGPTVGAGYRQYVGDNTHWDLRGLYSIKNYKLIELTTDSWNLASGRIDLHARTGWRDATQVAYYGLGQNSPKDRTNFRMKQATVGGTLGARPGGSSVFGASAAYEDYTLENGSGSAPSIEEVFTPATAPGLGANPSYLHTSASAGIDWRPSPGYARHGGLYQVTYHNYADTDDTYSFDRVDGEIVQHIPIVRENWVISLHGLVQTTLDDDDTVPYFLLPSLGSSHSLRAFGSWRFRDRHSILTSGEFRWIPSRLALDMAFFYDAGKVTSRREDLSLTHLRHDIGVGIRLHSPLATPLRIDVARGNEGVRLTIAGGAAF
jgi:Omp85 superfamily domain